MVSYQHGHAYHRYPPGGQRGKMLEKSLDLKDAEQILYQRNDFFKIRSEKRFQKLRSEKCMKKHAKM